MNSYLEGRYFYSSELFADVFSCQCQTNKALLLFVLWETKKENSESHLPLQQHIYICQEYYICVANCTILKIFSSLMKNVMLHRGQSRSSRNDDQRKLLSQQYLNVVWVAVSITVSTKQILFSISFKIMDLISALLLAASLLPNPEIFITCIWSNYIQR